MRRCGRVYETVSRRYHVRRMWGIYAKREEQTALVQRNAGSVPARRVFRGYSVDSDADPEEQLYGKLKAAGVDVAKFREHIQQLGSLCAFALQGSPCQRSRPLVLFTPDSV